MGSEPSPLRHISFMYGTSNGNRSRPRTTSVVSKMNERLSPLPLFVRNFAASEKVTRVFCVDINVVSLPDGAHLRLQIRVIRFPYYYLQIRPGEVAIEVSVATRGDNGPPKVGNPVP